MKKVLCLFFIIYASIFGQTKNKDIVVLAQNDFDVLKIAENKYNFWWHRNKNIWFPGSDTIPYLVNDSQYKGLLNYGLKYQAKDRKNFVFSEDLIMYKINVRIETFNFYPKDSIAEIIGNITGGWPNNKRNHKNDVNIFIGNLKDTLKIKYLDFLFDPKKIKISYKGKEIFKNIPLDTFPAKYLHSYKHLKTNHGSTRRFNLKFKVGKNTFLVFSASSCYSEIYNLGSLNFHKIINGENIKSFKKKKRFNSITIINDNIHKNKSFNIQAKREKPKYYVITERAENYILSRKYGLAKKEYNQLFKMEGYVFARDIHNAIRCAIKARDYDSAIAWCEKLVLKGIELDYFNDKIFNPIKNKKKWNLFKSKFETLHIEYEKGKNLQLIEGITKLVEEDQFLYSKDDLSPHHKAKKTQLIDKKFLKLIENEGFPTEEKIGVPFSQNTGFFNIPYLVLLMHSRKVQSPILNDVLRKNESYHDLYRSSLRSVNNAGKNCLHVYKGKLYNRKSCGSNMSAINKLKFKFNNKYNFLIDLGNFTVIPYEKNTEEEDERHLRENFHYVEELTSDWDFYKK